MFLERSPGQWPTHQTVDSPESTQNGFNRKLRLDLSVFNCLFRKEFALSMPICRGAIHNHSFPINRVITQRKYSRHLEITRDMRTRHTDGCLLTFLRSADLAINCPNSRRLLLLLPSKWWCINSILMNANRLWACLN